ncbi:hypothetical protein GCM10022254_57510 [Actinomadura meridiana]|uniref:Uncharacterized protein n=1 Tax=Actinomadura meridiana TaxID=559626 RepID=A0ABP8CGN3_9ACTN
MKPRIRRTAAMLTGTAAALIAFASVVPAQAQAASGCETLRASVNNSKGQRGGTVQATICLGTTPPLRSGARCAYAVT